MEIETAQADIPNPYNKDLFKIDAFTPQPDTQAHPQFNQMAENILGRYHKPQSVTHKALKYDRLRRLKTINQNLPSLNRGKSKDKGKARRDKRIKSMVGVKL